MQFRFFRNAIIVGRENSFFIQEQRELDIGIRNCSISRFQILFFRGKYKSNRITISYILFEIYHLAVFPELSYLTRNAFVFIPIDHQ